MKSTWLTFCVVAAIALLGTTEPKSDEPGNAPASAADPMSGKKPGDVRDDNGLKMKLVWCPPRNFTMGSPKSEKDRFENEDQVEVTLTKGFWLGKYEVTQSEWKQVMATEFWKGANLTKEGADFPATWVNWPDATEFCRKLTEQERNKGRMPDGWEYTLPTEAQWECACRAGTKTKFSFGDDESKLGEYAWFVVNTSIAGEGYAHQMGRKKPNPWGLCDMHGNVWEWCRDYYAEKLPGGRDPEVTEKAYARVLRGGSWRSDVALCRSAYRWPTPGARDNFIGFRVALSSVQPVK